MEFYVYSHEQNSNFKKFFKQILNIEKYKKRVEKLETANQMKITFLISYIYKTFHINFHRIIDSFQSKLVFEYFHRSKCCYLLNFFLKSSQCVDENDLDDLAHLVV